LNVPKFSKLLGERTHYFSRKHVAKDAVAGFTLGVESIPDAMASGVLAGVNPIYGLYAVMLSTPVGALLASSAFMSVQTTGAMSVLVSDVGEVHQSSDPQAALFTLAVLTGVLMIAAGAARLGTILRFVSNAVMAGFINGVAIIIILGQLGDLTGSSPEGSNKVAQTIYLATHISSVDWRSLLIGLFAIALIVTLPRTRMKSFGLVVALVAASIAVAVLSWQSVDLVREVADIPDALPRPVWPALRTIPALIVPAISLAFVGLVQGAGISQNYKNPDGTMPDASGDFIGQGAANVAAGLFRGMPVGGSLSATALITGAGARTRFANIFAGITMAVVLLVFGDAVGRLAMPALAGLLIVIGFQTLKPHQIALVWNTGPIQQTVMATTFALTLLLPLQHAVLAGVGLSVLLFVVRQSNRLVLKRMVLKPGHAPIEEDAPETLEAGDVVVLSVYGSLFFAAAKSLGELLPKVTPDSRGATVIINMRTRSQIGSTLAGTFDTYQKKLAEQGSTLMLSDVGRRLFAQLDQMDLVDKIGTRNIFDYNREIGRSALEAVRAAQRTRAASHVERDPDEGARSTDS
jgi:SulP family sulfate permease